MTFDYLCSIKIKMKTADYISNTIDRFPKGYVFTYSDFNTEVEQRQAVIKALNRMAASGKLSKLGKGKYYKPEGSPFGNLQPNQAQVVKDLLQVNGKITGYLTGYSIYNQLGLTTQVGNTIQIGKNLIRPNFKRDRYTITFIKQTNTITKDNIPLLQLLDAIRYIKKIPDASVEASCRRLLIILEELDENEIRLMVKLALKYPPSTRAVLGAVFEQLQKNPLFLEPLYSSLNPITTYKLFGTSKVLSITKKWNII